MKLQIIAIVSLLLSNTQGAFAAGSEWIKILHDSGNIGFQFCSSANELSCQRIGQRDYYGAEELLNLHHRLMKKAEITVGAGAVLIGATALTGGALGWVYGSFTFGSSLAGAMGAGAGLGAAAGTGLTAGSIKLSNLSPIANYQASKTLDERILLSTEVKYNGSITEFRKHLEYALNTLN